MKKKKKYIRPEVEIIGCCEPTIMAGSDNDKPYTDAKKHTDFDRSSEWENMDNDLWGSVGSSASSFPKSKSLWDD